MIQGVNANSHPPVLEEFQRVVEYSGVNFVGSGDQLIRVMSI